LTYAGVLFVFAYFFAIIGMEAFKGRITFYGYDEANLPYRNLFCGNPNLENSEFYRQQYCANNFNNILRSFVTLSELLVVNQWHILAEGFELATGSKYTRIFFISFHLLSVIIILNIFTALSWRSSSWSTRTLRKARWRRPWRRRSTRWGWGSAANPCIGNKSHRLSPCVAPSSRRMN